MTYDSDSSDNEYCETIWPEPAVNQVNPFGKYICATTSKYTFASATRPNLSNECPEGYVICSQNTSANTGICVPEGEESECPINDISFESNSFFDSNASTGGSYWSE